ncbi:MAG: type II toxin-antitoxin system VapC family toxin [Candidatus Contendobacter sp.]|jgi:predicted nucleic acid-binding protein|nr:type II toxin-antitoxin system VapC family toxin [Candidatus Contendobacter sp.]
MYLLDTNVVSELRKPRPHGAVVAWLQSTAEADLYLSAVTLGEIQAGIELTREQDATKASEIEAWADLVAASYSVLPMDGKTFRVWTRLMHRKSDTFYEDAMIAATAIAHQLTVVTRNVADFADFNVSFLNPFETTRP